MTSEYTISMPYHIAPFPLETVSDPNWKEFCPKCNAEKRVLYLVKMINAYGCYDFTQALQLECMHLLMPWERVKKEVWKT